jgi:hypothetical protein
MRLPVTLPVRRSRSLVIALVTAHLLAGAGLVATGVPAFVKLLVVGLLMLSLGLALRRRPVTAIVLKADGTLTFIYADGREVACEADASTTVFPWLIVLRARSLGRIESLTLPPDALGADGHRQLRLWLKWKAKPSA